MQYKHKIETVSITSTIPKNDEQLIEHTEIYDC